MISRIAIIAFAVILILCVLLILYFTYSKKKESFEGENEDLKDLFVESFIQDSIENFQWTVYENFEIDNLNSNDSKSEFVENMNQNKRNIHYSIISLKYFANNLNFFYGNSDIPDNILNFQSLAEQLKIPKKLLKRIFQSHNYIRKWIKNFNDNYSKYEKGEINTETLVRKVAPEYNENLNYKREKIGKIGKNKNYKNRKIVEIESFEDTKYFTLLKNIIRKYNYHIHKFHEKLEETTLNNTLDQNKKELWKIARKFMGKDRKYLFNKIVNDEDNIRKFCNYELTLEDYEPEIFVENYEIWEKIKSGVKSGYEYVKDAVKRAGKYIIEKGSEVGKNILEGIKKAGLWVKEVSTAAYEAAKKLGSSTLELIEKHAIPILKDLLNQYIIIEDGKREDGTPIKEVHIKLAPVRSLLKHAIIAFAISLPLPLTGPVVMKLLDLGFDYILLKLQSYISKFINYIIETKFPDFKYAVFLENFIFENYNEISGKEYLRQNIEKINSLLKDEINKDEEVKIKDEINKDEEVKIKDEINKKENINDETKKDIIKLLKYNLGKEEYEKFKNILNKYMFDKEIIYILDKFFLLKHKIIKL